MRSDSKFFLLLAGLILAMVVMLKWQRNSAAQLRDEIAGRRQLADEWAQLNAGHRHLLSSQVNPDDLKKLVADRYAMSALLGEIEAMKRRADSTTRSTRQLPAEKPVQPPMERGPVPVNLWKNAGQATPAAAFETLLWASAGGDLDALARTLHMDSVTRTEATEMFDKLPSAIQQEIGTPERLIALLTAKDAPLGSAQILNADEMLNAGDVAQETSKVAAPSTMRLNARVVDAEGNAKELLLTLRADHGVWQLTVPDAALEKYAALLQLPAESAASTDNGP